MKKFLILSFLFIALISEINAQPKVSYIIPDLGSPGMNTYIEIISPFDPTDPAKSAKNFRTDGLYMNSPGEILRVRCANDADTNKIKIGPLVVSWDGRLISTQIFVLPNVQPNSDDWERLLPAYRIPLYIEVKGLPPAIDTFYIVKPFPFWGKTGGAESVIGDGTLGKRSRRGAMIVDSMNLGDVTYTVSVKDCDPSTNGNQGYLPFVFLSKGKILSRPNATINVNGDFPKSGHGGNGGPGGGGGGGKFCDMDGLGASPTADNGGDGFTGGGMGGYNKKDAGSYTNIGVGTGAAGASINEIPPPEQWPKNQEASGAGTGHPFGSCGRGTVDGDDDAPKGGYGGASGYRQNKRGGAGGYATNGRNSTGVLADSSGGKRHGNDMVVPIAGGSGGASGNPQAYPIKGCSGSGGGGGGAIRIYAQIVTNLNVTANGGDGAKSSYGSGGAGSGGHVNFCSKLDATGINLYADSGRVDDHGAGLGRIRYDIGTSSAITMFPPRASIYKGPATDTNNIIIYRQFTLKGGKGDNRSIRVFIKSESSDWQEVANTNIRLNGNLWEADLDLTGNDSLFFLVAMQDVDKTNSIDDINKHLYDPEYVMSQAAANIFFVPKLPKIDGKKPIALEINNCPGETKLDSTYIKNIGDAPLILDMDLASLSLGNQGFQLIAPTAKTTVLPKDSIWVYVRFSYQIGQTGTIRDTLIIPHNDKYFGENPWKIPLEAIIRKLSYKIFDSGTLKNIDTIDFGKVCVGSSRDTSAEIMNLSPVDINMQNPVIIIKKEFPLASITTKRLVPNGIVQFSVTFTPDAAGKFTDTLIFEIEECKDFKDTVLLMGEGVQTDLYFVPTTYDFQEVRIGLRDTATLLLKNRGTADAYITMGDLTLNPNLPEYKIIETIPALPILLKPGEELQIKVEFTPLAERNYSTTLDVNVSESSNACKGSAKIDITGDGARSKLKPQPDPLEFGTVASCLIKRISVWISNTGVVAGKIISQANISGNDASYFSIVKEPTPVPFDLTPGDSVEYIIEFNAAAPPYGTKTAKLTVQSDDADIIVNISAKNEKLNVTIDPNPLFFGSAGKGQVKNINFTITNNGELEIHIKDLKNFHPDVSVTPKIATITGGDFSTFTVTMNYNNFGEIKDSLQIIIDSPCPDTLYIGIEGNCLRGDIKYDEKMDFGLLAACEDSVKVFNIENTGQTPVEVTEQYIEPGQYSSLFIFVMGPLIPTNIDVANSSDISIIKFDPKKATDGKKQAILVTKIIMNGGEDSLKTILYGEKRSGLLSIPDSVIFARTVVGFFTDSTIKLKNVGEQTITIESSDPLIKYPNNEFSVQQPPVISNIVLPKGDSIEIVVRFTPTAVQYYEDTLRLRLKIKNCDEEKTIVLKSWGAPPKNITVKLPILNEVLPTLKDYKIPIFASIEPQGETLTNAACSATISFNAGLFYPTSLSNGIIIKNSIVNNERLLEISIPNITIPSKDSVLTEILGATMLGETDSTGLKWLDFKWTAGELVGKSVQKIDGSLKIKICNEGPEGNKNRLIKTGEPLAMMLMPNPANDKITVAANLLETGEYRLELFDIHGRSLELKRWNISKTSDKEFDYEFDTSTISEGLYYLILRSPTQSKVVPLFILK